MRLVKRDKKTNSTKTGRLAFTIRSKTSSREILVKSQARMTTVSVILTIRKTELLELAISGLLFIVFCCSCIGEIKSILPSFFVYSGGWSSQIPHYTKPGEDLKDIVANINFPPIKALSF